MKVTNNECVIERLFSDADQFKEHCQRHKTTLHDLHKSVVRKGMREQMFPMQAKASQVIMLEVTKGIEVKTDKDCNNLGIGHHPLSVSFRNIYYFVSVKR